MVKTVLLPILLLAGIEAQGPGSVLVDGLPSPEEKTYVWTNSFLENPQFTVLVVRVLDAHISEGTRGAPPEGTFRVEEVLRGNNVEPGDYRYQARSPYPPSNQESSEAWKAEPLSGPRSDDELIVIAYVGEKLPPGSPIVLQGPLIRLTPETRRQVEDRLVRDSPLQTPLFFVVLFAPLLGLLDRGRWLSIPVAFGAYAVYEALMSPYYNIRVDVLLLWPALVLAVLGPFLTAWLRGRRRA